MSDFRYTRGVTALSQNASDATHYLPLNGDSNSTIEANVQTLLRKAYTGKNLYVYCSVYGGSQGPITVALRESGVTSAVTVTLNATGIFEDVTNTEALDDGDLVNYILSVTGTGHGDTFSLTTVSCVLSHATEDWPVLVNGGATYNLVAGGTYFATVAGYIQNAGRNATETYSQRTARAATTLSNLAAYCVAEGTDTAQTLKTRVDGANGGQSITINASGRFEDTSGTDSVSVGSEINTSLVSTGQPTIRQVQVLSSSTARQAIAVYGIGKGAGSGDYYPSLDGSSIVTTEAEAGVTQRTTNVLKNLFCYVSAYDLSIAATVDLRINAASSAVTTTPNATGVFEDTVNSVTLVATDEANYRSSATAGTGSITVQLISVEETQPAGVAGSGVTEYGMHAIGRGAVAGHNTAVRLGGWLEYFSRRLMPA